MLVTRLRRWPNITATLGLQRLLLDGSSSARTVAAQQTGDIHPM